jgi:uncharacterized repeat protein (TIGR03803 family)
VANLTTLVSFDGTDGAEPSSELILDSGGNLYGTTVNGGANGDGSVFEIANAAGSYASTPTTLASFDSSNDAFNYVPGLVMDADGNLLGVTGGGGADGAGAIFEIAKTADSYASSAAILASFNSTDGMAPLSALTIGSDGNLYGTTFYGGSSSDGTVFELAKTGVGYAGTPTTLINFNGADGADLYQGALIADPAGNLFGTTLLNSPFGFSTVFELAKTPDGYANTVTTLVAGFTGNGDLTGLVMDASGNLFGTTGTGDTVFEIAKTAAGYADQATTLATFTQATGTVPQQLIIDAAGDLFGTTEGGGVNGDGTVFEIAKTADGYASTITTLASFDDSNGSAPPQQRLWLTAVAICSARRPRAAPMGTAPSSS